MTKIHYERKYTSNFKQECKNDSIFINLNFEKPSKWLTNYKSSQKVLQIKCWIIQLERSLKQKNHFKNTSIITSKTSLNMRNSKKNKYKKIPKGNKETKDKIPLYILSAHVSIWVKSRYSFQYLLQLHMDLQFPVGLVAGWNYSGQTGEIPWEWSEDN